MNNHPAHLPEDDADFGVVFHGTRAGIITRFKPHIRRGEQVGFGIHFSFEKSFAMQYAQNPRVARRGKSPVLMAARICAKNPLLSNEVVFEGSAEFDLAVKLAKTKLIYPKDEQGRRAVYVQNAIDACSPDRALKSIEAAGYDSVIYRARLASATPYGFLVSQESRCISLFDPSQVLESWVAADLMTPTPFLTSAASEGLSL